MNQGTPSNQNNSARADELLAQEPKLHTLIWLAWDRLRAKEVWVFGSRARGDHRPDSDWDVFIVVPDGTPDEQYNPMVTWLIGHDAGLTCDVVAETESETRAAENTINTLAYRLPREGVRIA